MQYFILFLFSAVLSISSPTQTPGDQILGSWKYETQNRVLEFVQNGSTYDAIIREANEPEYIGQKQISSLKFHKNNRYNGGSLHILKRGNTADCSAKLLSDTELELTVKFGFMSRTQILTKVQTE